MQVIVKERVLKEEYDYEYYYDRFGTCDHTKLTGEIKTFYRFVKNEEIIRSEKIKDNLNVGDYIYLSDCDQNYQIIKKYHSDDQGNVIYIIDRKKVIFSKNADEIKKKLEEEVVLKKCIQELREENSLLRYRIKKMGERDEEESKVRKRWFFF